MPEYWWNTAVELARELAATTHVRHSVTQGRDGYWLVEPVWTLVGEALEPCS